MEFMLPTKRKSPIVQFDLNLKRRCVQGMVMIVKSNKVSRGVQKEGGKGGNFPPTFETCTPNKKRVYSMPIN
jgi:hypothetical protein